MAVSLLLCLGTAAAGETALPAPSKTGGMPLADALAARRSTRSFADVELSPQQLSDLLWATAGINRDDGHTTYPVAMGRKDMTLFVFTKSGVFRYDPDSHALVTDAAGDRRADTGSQPFVGQAAVNFVFVHDMALWEDSGESGEVWGYAHAGAMMQNAYLHAAAQNWSAVVRGFFDGKKLGALLKLTPKQRVVLTQSIGPRE
jgi:nitroreductase